MLISGSVYIGVLFFGDGEKKWQVQRVRRFAQGRMYWDFLRERRVAPVVFIISPYGLLHKRQVTQKIKILGEFRIKGNIWAKNKLHHISCFLSQGASPISIGSPLRRVLPGVGGAFPTSVPKLTRGASTTMRV